VFFTNFSDLASEFLRYRIRASGIHFFVYKVSRRELKDYRSCLSRTIRRIMKFTMLTIKSMSKSTVEFGIRL
jgi:hypothetical protein